MRVSFLLSVAMAAATVGKGKCAEEEVRSYVK